MARCPKCGQESPDQARFCRFCGERMGAGATAPALDPAQSPEQRSQQLLEEAFRLSEQGRILAAIQTCQQALALNSRSTSAHSLLGTLFERQGDRDRAIREYEQVLTLSPESTVERRRLNELMGVPTAREPVAISPKVARYAITGASVLVAIIAVVAVLLSRPQSAPEKTPRTPQTQTENVIPNAGMLDQSVLPPAPGRASYGGPAFPAPAPARAPSSYTELSPTQGGSFPATNANPYIIPSTGGDRYYGNAAPVSSGWVNSPAYQGTPIISGGGWSPAPTGWSVQSGRDYFLQGNYTQAAQSYRTYLDRNPEAGGAPREELAWVYMQMGDRDLAVQTYHDALSNYQTDINQGQNVEAASHGLRTCQSAIRALEAR